jgi:DNA repair protein SbcD/Mre11
MFKFLHAADIHLDSPLRGLIRYEPMPVDEIRQATRHAFDRLVRLAIEEKVQFVLIAGDLYDGDWKDNSTGLFFTSRMGRLREVGIHVYLIKGNHDAASVVTKSLRLPENTHFFESRKAHSLEVPGADAVIHGQSFHTRHVDENLAAAYPPRDPSRFNIGMLHTSLTGFEGHEPYAPCSADDLRSKGYEYWALGHVHNAQEIVRDDPWIVFPGNIQGRNIRETGAKGCRIVTVDDAHRVARCEFHPLDVFRWMQMEIDVSGAAKMDAVEQAVDRALRTVDTIGDINFILRLVLKGGTPLASHLVSSTDWRDSLRSLTTDVGAERMWLEKIEVQCSAPRQASSMEGPLAEVAASLRNLSLDDTKELFAPLLQKVPDDVKEYVQSLLDPAQPRYAELLGEVEALLSGRLSGQAVMHEN